MSETTHIQLEIPAEKHAMIEQRAHERGFDTVSDYLLALAEIDAFQETPDVETKAGILAGLRQSLMEARDGVFFDISVLDTLDDE
jgi:hypothetical protein